MNPREKAPAQQLDQSPVGFTTPDKHARANAIASGVFDGHSMSHIFARETERAGDAARPQVLQADQTNANNRMPMPLVDSQRRRQETLHDLGIRPEVQQHAPGDHAFDQGQHLCGILAEAVYSYRSASIGFSREAFNAGKKPETIPTIDKMMNEIIITLNDAWRKIAPSWSAVL